MNEALAEELFREAAEAIETLPPLPDELVDLARTHRRRRAGIGVAAAVAVLAVVGLGTWLGSRPDRPPPPAAPVVTPAERAAPVTWWANGVLHLRHVEVELPRVTDVVEVDDGAVVGDQTGAVQFVAADGTVTELGRKVPREPLVASDDTGWAAWVDPSGDTPELVVYDVTAGSELARRALPDTGPPAWAAPGGPRLGSDESHPIALDRDRLSYAALDGDWTWTVPNAGAERVDPPDLVDVAVATRVWQVDRDTLRVAQPLFSVELELTGSGAQISPDALYVLTRVRTPIDQFGTVLAYDARSGDRLWTGLRGDEVAVAASPGLYGTVTYVVGRREDMPGAGEFVRTSFSAPWELRTCSLDEHICTTLGKIPLTGTLPVLPD